MVAEKQIKYYEDLSNKLKEVSEIIDSIISELRDQKTGYMRRIMEKKRKINEIDKFIRFNYGL